MIGNAATPSASSTPSPQRGPDPSRTAIPAANPAADNSTRTTAFVMPSAASTRHATVFSAASKIPGGRPS
jgi:hypothetical protein